MSEKEISETGFAATPQWLDEEFLEKVLKYHEKCEEIKITELKVNPASILNNLASIIFKIDVSYEIKNHSKVHSNFILKTIPEEKDIKLDFQKYNTAFPTEMFIYEKILPKMHELLRAKNDDTVFAPEFIYCTDTPVPMIILKDLSFDGFCSPMNLLEIDATKVVTEKLSKFHACSMFLHENGTPIDSLTESFVKPTHGKDSFTEVWIKPGLELAISYFKKWEGCQNIAEKLIKSEKTIIERFTQIYVDPSKGPYNILNHGDFHHGNLMQRNGGVLPQDLLLIDFQFSFFGTPAVDFIYMLYLMTSQKVRKNHRNEIMELYFEKFVATLKLLDFKGKIPTFTEFENELKRCRLMELVLLLCFGAYFYVNWEDKSTKTVVEAAQEKNLYAPTIPIWENNEEWKEYVTKSVEEMINKGFLD
ncbi:uncharacterized protein LOC134837697 [Culicoides brevitarsis]|uniref:uncharacterized protein LOC134837697 n=1 Tax=Culicoides brevitarsis TaxID=469753 RepID=UPI00307BD6C1